MRSDQVPFFSRLSVKQAVVLTVLVLVCMTTLTVLQMDDTLRETQRDAVDKGRVLGGAIAPLIDERTPAELLHAYFDNVVSSKNNVDYVQLIEADGRVRVSSSLGSSARNPAPLSPGWILNLDNKVKLDRNAVPVPWTEGGGVDVFIALLPHAERASIEEIQNARHLRIGINFDALVRYEVPRIIWHMAVFTLIATIVLIGALVVAIDIMLRPLRELHKGFQAVAKGNFDYHVSVMSRDELGRLAQAFNATSARLRAAFQQIEQLAAHDPLTLLPNRRLFDVRIAAEAARSRRYGHPFGLIVMDLDKFKDINDRYGHPAGDEVLRMVARTIEANMRETDMPARIGGEEFAALLPETDPSDVLAVAEKLRQAVSQCVLPQKAGLPEGLRVTLSAGIACSAGHLVTPEAMMAAADAALYKSKGEGRNKVTMAPKEAGKTDFVAKVEDDPGASTIQGAS